LAPGGTNVLATNYYEVIAADLDAGEINSYPVPDSEVVLLLSPSLSIDQVYTGTQRRERRRHIEIITATKNGTAILTNVVVSDNFKQ
jgi:hypothetical protein